MRKATDIEYEYAKIHLFINQLGWWLGSMIAIVVLLFFILIFNEANDFYFSLTLIKALCSLLIIFVVFINISSLISVKPSRYILPVSGILKHKKSTDTIDASGALGNHRRYLYFMQNAFKIHLIGNAQVRFPLYASFLYEPLYGKEVHAEIVPFEYRGKITKEVAFVVKLNAVINIDLSYKEHGRFYAIYLKYLLYFTLIMLIIAIMLFSVSLQTGNAVWGICAIVIGSVTFAGLNSFLANCVLKRKYEASHEELLALSKISE